MTTHAPVVPKRVRARELLATLLGREDMAINLEVNIYNYAIEQAKSQQVDLFWDNPMFEAIYSRKVRSILFNLRDSRNPELLQNVLAGNLKLHKLTKMTPLELFPRNWEEIINRVIERRLRSEVTRMTEEVVEGAFQCARCKSKKTVYTQYQIRSADEPMTTFVTCLNCDKRWKFN